MRSRKLLRKTALRVLSGLFLLVLAYAAWFGWRVYNQDEATMRQLGNFLWTQEQPRSADLIYVLGGDYITRIPYAAHLYAEGLAPKVVIPRENMGGSSSGARNGQEHFTDASLRILQEKGVPPGAILEWNTPTGVRSTADEIRALAIYVENFPQVSRVLIVTSQYHTRRTAYMASRAVPGRVECIVLGVPAPQWGFDNWWKYPGSRQTTKEEYLKLMYYLPRYFFG